MIARRTKARPRRLAPTLLASVLAACSAAEGNGNVDPRIETNPSGKDGSVDSPISVIDFGLEDSEPAFDLGVDSGSDASFVDAGDASVLVDAPETGPEASVDADAETALDAVKEGESDAVVDDTCTDTDAEAASDDTSDDATLDGSVVDVGTEAESDTGVTESASADSGAGETSVDAGPADTWLAPPTIELVGPSAGSKFPFSKTSDVCQSRLFTVTFAAPAGLQSIQYKFITPDAGKASTAMVGTCTGAPAYSYFMDPTRDPTKIGATAGTVMEDVSLAGLYGGVGGLRWWWCTSPGSTVAGAKTTFVKSPPAPGAPGVQTLSNYCYAKSTPPDSDLGSRWQLQVTIVDLAGRTATATLYFWLHL